MFDILIGIRCDSSTCPKSEVSLSQQFERLDLSALRLICRDLNPKDLPLLQRYLFYHTPDRPFSQESRDLKELPEHEKLSHQVQAIVITGSDDIGRGFA